MRKCTGTYVLAAALTVVLLTDEAAFAQACPNPLLPEQTYLGISCNSKARKNDNAFKSKFESVIFNQARVQGTNFTEAEWISSSAFKLRAQNSTWNGAKIEGSNFQGANFNKANAQSLEFKGGSARNLKARGTNLNGAKFEGDAFPLDMRAADLSPAGNGQTTSLLGVSMSGVDLSDADMTEVNMGSPDTSLSEVNLDGANLTDADLSGGSIGASMNGTILDGANTNGAKLECGEFGSQLGSILGVTATGEGSEWLSCNIAGLSAAGAELGGSFINIDASEADLSGVRLSGSLWDGVNLNGANLDDAMVDFMDPEGEGGTFFIGDLTIGGLPDSDKAAWQRVGVPRGNLTGVLLEFAGLAGIDGLDLNCATMNSGGLSGGEDGAALTNLKARGIDLFRAELAGELLGADFRSFPGACSSQATDLSCANALAMIATPSADGPSSFRDAVMQGITLGPRPGTPAPGAPGAAGAQLDAADLRGADLSPRPGGFGACDAELLDPQSTSLRGASLRFADLRGTDLSDADARKADFQGAATDLDTDVSGVTWGNTICPDGSNSNDNGGTCVGFGF